MIEQSSLSLIVRFISATPTWVWFVLGYLTFIGIRAIKSREVYIPKLFIIPVVLSGLKYKIFMTAEAFIWIGYFSSLALSSFLSFRYSATQKIEIIKERMSVQLPGTYWTLVILLSFFIVKYICAYANVTQPHFYQELQLFEISASGLLSGYFFGKAISYLTLLKK